jgi:hypothetical protein
MRTFVSNMEARRAIAGMCKASAAIRRGVFVARAAAGTVATETTHNAASHGVAIRDIRSGAFGPVQRLGLVPMVAAAPLEVGMAVRSTGSGFANRKTVTSELAIDSSLGLDSEITAGVDDNEAIKWTSTSPLDIGKYLMIIGVDTDDSTEKKELIGPLVTEAVEVSGAVLWSGTAAAGMVGAVLMSENNVDSPVAAVGTITIRSATTETTIATIAAGSSSMGVLICSKATGHEGVSAGGGQVDIVADGATTKNVIHYGLDAAGAELIELDALAGAVGQTSTGSFDVLRYVVLSEVEAARTVTITGQNDSTNTTKGYVASDCKTRNGIVMVDLVAP